LSGSAALAVAAALVLGLVAGCGAKGAGPKADSEATATGDPMAVLRRDVDRLRTEIAEIRTLVEAAQRGGVEHADRAAGETRAEIEAVQKAMEASARHDVQRQIEVLDAQTRRIDVLDRRVTEQGQTLRRVELAITGIESQLARLLETPPAASGRGARTGASARASAPGGPPVSSTSSADDSAPPPAANPSGAAGADLTPPAMLGLPRNPPPPPAASPAPPVADSPPRAAKPAEAPRETKAAAPAREAKATPPERAPAETARVPKARPPATPPAKGSTGAQELFDRAMSSWNRGEHGQAVLDFEELVQTFPTDPLVAPAQFRIGEAYYAARDFERAVLGYRKAVELAPTSKETPQALLRLGLAYRAQKRESEARQAWNQLVRDFPDSEVTEEARRALRGR
jgi:TolA-binding protein